MHVKQFPIDMEGIFPVLSQLKVILAAHQSRRKNDVELHLLKYKISRRQLDIGVRQSEEPVTRNYQKRCIGPGFEP